MSGYDGTRPLRVVVCGTTFGQVYLEGLHAAGPQVELTGVFARGSDRSRRCAKHYGVPLLTDLREVAEVADAACVVVRAGLLGGGGCELAQALMTEGVHVLQEHPLHHKELAACLRTARATGTVYHLNAFYPYVPVVRRFIAAARRMLELGPPVYIDAACGFQLAYSLLDILGCALGSVRPWSFAAAPAEAAADRADIPFRALEGVIGGVPLTLRIQNQMDPSDPDNHAHVDHRITIGTEVGNLTLHATHGPIVFAQRPRYPHDPRDAASEPHFDGEQHQELPSATVLGDGAAPGFPAIFRTLWPPAVQHAVGDLRAAILAGGSDRRQAQHHLSVCLLWQDLSARLGAPELLRRAVPAPLRAGDLEALAAAAAPRDAVTAEAVR
ncbi:MAG: pyochelin biosynthesis protein PchG [Solirubrobacteraceae bacterium]|nr:pyochelin biosynthesis protein PchG [Solirubrobacteraceae bacterium]